MATSIYYHQLDPFLIQFTQNFGIRWYSLAYFLGFVATYLLALYLKKNNRLNLPASQVLDTVTYGVLGAIFGGRLGYCLFYNPELFVSLDSSFPFWGVLKIHQGGMASHGGILGFVVFGYLYCRYKKMCFLSFMDLGAFGGAVGLFLGRIANFINGELYGRVMEKSGFFGVKFPSELFLWSERIADYKEQLLSLKAVLPSLKNFSELKIQIPDSLMWEQWLERALESPAYKDRVTYICNFIVDVSHHPSVRALLEPLLFVRHPSQLYQSFWDGLVPCLLISVLWLKPHKPGLISLVWISTYLMSRIFTEFFRMPDADIGYQLFHLTRGQWLSILTLVFGVSIYGYFVYKNKPKGWKL